MTDLERTAILRSIDAWKRASPVLERVREEDIRAADTVSSIAAFRGFVLAKVKTHPPLPTSGLIEQQQIFRLLAGVR